MLLGESDAIAALYDRYAKSAYSIAFQVLRDPVQAEGIVSDLFLFIWHEPGPFLQITGGLAPVLASMARKRAINLLLQGRESGDR